MEGINTDEFDKILGLVDTDYTTTVALSFGYRSDDDSMADLAKVRFAKDEVIKVI